ncbi:hypothetical protein ES288_D11G115600v1 [Gossypium darwinii]|uniref:Uncharacterized protein n=3 Tax=Gossypium TaxID=3633 RepID=A0A5D2IMI7_GOSTO|nr:hypothetical protein ES288_D11G115600v1 [Gossypium darwinii]TYH43229.1 hypothetical protein ES332_D11G113600v1 [Gossypium tomentosum]
MSNAIILGSPTNRTWCSTSSIGVKSQLGILSQLGIHIFHLRIVSKILFSVTCVANAYMLRHGFYCCMLSLYVKAAGMVHSMAITEDGALFYWVSSDPHLRCQQLYSLCEKTIVSISAGKYWAATATAIGDVYMWDGKKSMDKPPVATRLHRVKGKKIP